MQIDDCRLRDETRRQVDRIVDAILLGHRTLGEISAATGVIYRSVNAQVTSLTLQQRVVIKNPSSVRKEQLFFVNHAHPSAIKADLPRSASDHAAPLPLEQDCNEYSAWPNWLPIHNPLWRQRVRDSLAAS